MSSSGVLRLVDQVEDPVVGYVLRKNKVRLEYTRDEYSDVDDAPLWTCDVEYKIYSTGATQHGSTYSLEVYFNKNNNGLDYQYEDLRVHSNIASDDLSVEIVSVSLSANAPDDIVLWVETETEVYRKLDASAVGYVHYDASSSEVRWKVVEGARWYDLEWVFIDSEDDSYAGFTGSSTESKPFEYKEPVRVRLSGNRYELQMIYPKGDVYFRVRPVGVWVENVDGDYSHIKPGSWGYRKSSSDNTLAHLSITSSFESSRNWQMNTSYAEQGKNKRVMSYLDGTLRSRQSLTNLSSEGVSVVAEQLYDYEGRPAVSILPAPVSSTSMNYISGLNKYSGTVSFGKTHFDGEDGMGLYESATESSAEYYSPNNAFSGAHVDFIPDADGYVYAQTVYTRDNTGRIAQSGGVGSAFAIGQGHETKYYYGTPNATELYRLFGTNVGKASHYKKNMVKDPNGQLSVSYVDQQGRTIATALAGGGTNNLEDLPSNDSEVLTVDLTDNNTIDYQEGLMVMTHRHLNTVDYTYRFIYDLDAALYEVTLTDPFGVEDPLDICLDCEYVLTITISDPEGEPVDMVRVSDSKTYTEIKEVISYTGTPDCNASTYSVNTIEFTSRFEDVGDYTITKTLEVVARAEDFLSDAASALTRMGLSEQGLIDQYLSVVDTTGCDVTCYDHAKTKAHALYPGYGKTKIDSVVPLIMDTMCLRLLNSAMEGDPTSCDYYLEQMKLDVSPGGWMYDDVNNDFWVSFDVDQVNTDLSNPSGTKSYYQDPDNWASGYEAAFVKYHREYCHWQDCDRYQATNTYDITSNYVVGGWTQAKTSGFADPHDETAGNNYTDQDPLWNVNLEVDNSFTLTGNDGTTQTFSSTDSYGAAITFLMNHYLPCQGIYSLKDAIDGQVSSCSSPSFTYPTDDQERWMLFKGAYQGCKKRVMDAVRADIGCTYYSDGKQYFEPLADLEDTDTQEDLLDLSASFWTSGCDEICDQNASLWLAQLQRKSGGNFYSSSADSTILYKSLRNYCLKNSCGPSNPFGLIVTTDDAFGTYRDSINTYFGVYIDSVSYSGYVDTCQGDERYSYHLVEELEDLVDFLNAELVSHYAQYPSGGSTVFVSQSTYGDLYNFGVTQLNPTYTHLNFNLDGCRWYLYKDDGNGGYVQIDTKKITHYGDVQYSFMEPYSIAGYYYQHAYMAVEIDDSENTIAHIYGEYYFGPANAFYTACFQMHHVDTIPCQPYIDTSFNAFDTRSYDLDMAREDCIELLYAQAKKDAQGRWIDLLEQMASDLLLDYKEECISGASESFTMNYELQEYHYTLYYYDQAGNLVQTVPPEGVVPLGTTAFPNSVYDQSTMPGHILQTTYKYNSLNQLVSQHTPDGGTTDFYYDNLGRLRFSQNDLQADANQFSYTRYDQLGRIIEVGEHKRDLFTGTPSLSDQVNDMTWPTTGWEVTRTHYDDVYSTEAQAQFKSNQDNLRSRVAATLYIENQKNTASASQDNIVTAATHYSYDVHGNVKELVQQQNYWQLVGDRFKHMSYDYDLVSGNVKQVSYQKGHYDQFFHRYDYDADNRIVKTRTSRDGERWETDARYEYYLHGPLARMIIGEDQVQGVDYAYTLQGWLKAVNSADRLTAHDMGYDGDVVASGNSNRYVAQDAFGFNLGYYQSSSHQDYKSIGEDDRHILTINGTSDLSHSSGGYHRLYNGNIGFMVTSLANADPDATIATQLNRYKYDQLNRIVESRSSQDVNLSAGLYTGTTGDLYKVDYTYDANGNLLSLDRWDESGDPMDELSYDYDLDQNNKRIDNRLTLVTESLSTPACATDYEGNHTYTYDDIGNLISDATEGINTIDWTVYGKVKNVNRTSTGAENLSFGYGPGGNRIYKVVKGNGSTPGNADTWNAQWYVRDASGNVMAVYDEEFDPHASRTYHYISTLSLSELPIYGSSRLGVMEGSGSESTTFAGESTASGFSEYELPVYDSYLEDEHTYTAYSGGGFKVSSSTGVTFNLEAEYERIYLEDTVFENEGEGVVSIGDGTLSDAQGTYIPMGTSVSITVSGTGLLDILANAVKMHPNTNFTLVGTKPITLIKDVLTSEVNSSRVLLNKTYELSNHLGNVLITLSDLKLGQDTDDDDISDMYIAHVISHNDYYAFGSLMPGRYNTPSERYRYGFQGQEGDDEMYGDKGSSVAFKYRIHDARIGRFLSVDPLFADFPWNSPYAFSENSVIGFIELEGLEKIHFMNGMLQGHTIDFTGFSEDDTKAVFLAMGYKWDSDIYDPDAKGEYWEVLNANTADDYSIKMELGTVVNKYPFEESKKANGARPYEQVWAQNWIQKIVLKDNVIMHDDDEAIKFTAQYITALAGIFSGGSSTYTLGRFISGAATFVTIDDLTELNGTTMIEDISRQIGGKNAENGYKIAKVGIHTANAIKGTVELTISLNNGETYNAIYDVVNKVLSQVDAAEEYSDLKNDEQ